jgi:arylsulfatase A-like enzyme
MIPRPPILSTALLSLLLGLASCSQEPAQPSLLVITLDTTRADYLSCYGSKRSRTPAMDGLAQSGVLFERTLASSAVTPVAHASIFTGQFPPGHGLRVLAGKGGDRLPPAATTLAEICAQGGWDTAAVHSAFPVSRRFGLDQGFRHFDSFEGKARIDETGKTTWDVKNLQRRSDETVDRALAWAAEAERPFMLWVHLWDPHDPTLTPPASFMQGVPQNGQGAYHPIRLYAREVEYLDLQIARLLEQLRPLAGEAGLIVALTSDHGEGLEDGMARHGWSAHRMLYGEQINVPMILAGPGVPQLKRVTQLVRTVDLLPTLTQLLGLPTQGGIDGLDLAPLWEGSDAYRNAVGNLSPRAAYADQINGYDGNASMVRRRPDAAFQFVWVEYPWKLYWRPHQPESSELFNLAKDSAEEINLLATRPKIAHRLLSVLAELKPWVTEPYGPPEDVDVQGALDALGYGGDGAADDPARPRPYPWKWVSVSEALGLPAAAGDATLPIVTKD